MIAHLAALALAIAVAQPSGAAADARSEFETARRYFDGDEYTAALPHFQKAYELSGHRPSTILALAQCERMLEMYKEALAHFEEYVASNPSDAEKEKIARTIDLLKEQIARQAERAAAEPPRPEPPRPEPPKAEESAPREATPPAAAAPLTTAPRRDEGDAESGSVLSSPLFWIISGAAVVVGGIALSVALSGERDLYGGNTGIVALPLHGH